MSSEKSSVTALGQPSAPVALPTFSSGRPQAWTPACTHLTMTRLFEPKFDREHMLEHAIGKGHPVNFDLLGLNFTEQVKPGPRGPESRSNRYSFFQEVDDHAMKLYSPDQIAAILKQRENLQHVLAMEEHLAVAKKRTYYVPSSGTATNIFPPPGFSKLNAEKPWVPQDKEECQFKCCHNCRPTCQSRSYLSLDGILKNDIPPTAAIGFGFHLQGTRPVMDAEVVKNIGCRPVPLPTSFQLGSGTPKSSPSSIWSILDVIDEQIVEMTHLEDKMEFGNGDHDYQNTFNCASGYTNGNKSTIQHPWTPPATPARKQNSRTEDGRLDFEDRPGIWGGHGRALWKSSFAMCCDKAAFTHACVTPLPPPTPLEDAFFHKTLTHMEAEEIGEGYFHDEPLEVADGIAVLEESVDIHIPDIVTQI